LADTGLKLLAYRSGWIQQTNIAAAAVVVDMTKKSDLRHELEHGSLARMQFFTQAAPAI